MSRTAWAVVGAGGLGLGGYLYATPYISLHQFREAIEARDLPAIERHVDFPKLRSSLKDQLNAKVMEEVARNGGDQPLVGIGIGALATAMAEPMINAAVNTYVSPAGLKTLLAGSQPVATRSDASSESSGGGRRSESSDPTVTLSYKTPNLFVAAARDVNDGQEVRFNFERYELVSWKLTSVSLP